MLSPIDYNGKKFQTSTKDIRNLLGFEGQKKWKDFTNRRLQLIDTFKLSEDKASKQDTNVKQVANILRVEFNYPITTASHFEKLVVAAIQSVRRNKKRSIKRQHIRPSEGEYQKTEKINTKTIVKTEHSLPKLTKINSDIILSRRSKHGSSGILIPDETNSKSFLNLNESIVQETYDPSQDEIIKTVLSDIVNNFIPLSDQKKRSQNSLPDLSNFLSNNDEDTELLININHNPETPFFLKEKLLQNIEKSRTCFEVSSSIESLEKFTLVSRLGKSAYETSINFIFEKFCKHDLNRIEFLTNRSNSIKFISSLSSNLFKSATRIEVATSLSVDSRVALLYLSIGSLIKDFGFEQTLYPLCELLIQHIFTQYPFPELKLKGEQENLKTSKSSKDAILLTLPIEPHLASKELFKEVTIKYRDKKQIFTFPLLSNGPPTFTEIMKNCRTLFNISSLNNTPLGLYHEESLITDDDILAQLFKVISSQSLVLDIKPIEK